MPKAAHCRQVASTVFHVELAHCRNARAEAPTPSHSLGWLRWVTGLVSLRLHTHTIHFAVACVEAQVRNALLQVLLDCCQMNRTLQALVVAHTV